MTCTSNSPKNTVFNTCIELKNWVLGYSFCLINLPRRGGRLFIFHVVVVVDHVPKGASGHMGEKNS